MKLMNKERIKENLNFLYNTIREQPDYVEKLYDTSLICIVEAIADVENFDRATCYNKFDLTIKSPKKLLAIAELKLLEATTDIEQKFYQCMKEHYSL